MPAQQAKPAKTVDALVARLSCAQRARLALMAIAVVTRAGLAPRAPFLFAQRAALEEKCACPLTSAAVRMLTRTVMAPAMHSMVAHWKPDSSLARVFVTAAI